MNMIERWRVAIRLARTISRSTKLASVERRKPRDDRRSFIVICDQRGRFHVRYYDTEDEYRRDYDDLTENEHETAWVAGYDKWSDKRG